MPLDLSPIWISLETSLTATAITLVIGVAAAIWRANRRGVGPALLDSIFLLPRPASHRRRLSSFADFRPQRPARPPAFALRRHRGLFLARHGDRRRRRFVSADV